MKKLISYISIAIGLIVGGFFVNKQLQSDNVTGIKIYTGVLTEGYSSKFDTIRVYLSKVSTPTSFVDSAVSMEGISLSTFNRSNTNGNYFISVKHRNSIKLWSNPIYLEFDSNRTVTYDFTTIKSNTLYNNTKLVNGKYRMFSGDVNQDGIIDASDLSLVENDAMNSLEGYVNTDLNNDSLVDATDLSIVENNMNYSESVIEKIPTKILPFRYNTPIKADVNKDILLLPYTSVIKVNNTFFMYYVIKGIGTQLDTSLDGVNWKFKAKVTVNRNNVQSRGDSLYSVIYKNGIWYSGWTSKGYVGPTYTEFINVATSTDGFHFTQYSGNPLPFRTGEDLSFWNNTDSLYCYIRPAIPMYVYPRTVGFMTSKDGINWSKIDTIIKFPNSDYTNSSSELYLKQPYNMNVIRIGNDWWGFMHVLRLEDDGSESWRFPYTGLEQTIETHLMYSRNGRTWSYTNNKKAFLPIHDSVKQVYGLPTIVNDSIYIYSFESTLRHAGYGLSNGGQSAVDFAKGKYWKIFRYKIAISDLNLYKQ